MRNREKTINHIIDAAEHRLLSVGFMGFKVNDIAATADAGKPLIYRYFDDMDGLRKALYMRALDSFDHALQTHASLKNTPILLVGRLLADQPLWRHLILWELVQPMPDKASLLQRTLNFIHQDQARPDLSNAKSLLLTNATLMTLLLRDHMSQLGPFNLKNARDLAQLEFAQQALMKDGTQ